jgi:serine/threonine protein kinase
LTGQKDIKRSQRYTPIRELGSGAFARVFLAHDEKLNRDVAIKVFNNRATQNGLARFEREAVICTNLRHPNIIRIYDASINSKQPKIVMEYIDAGDLFELIERRQLSIEESLKITRDIGNALDYLHGMNILHRDLKPANIMIQEPLKAILMDFNLAFSDEFTVLTEEGFTVGTPRFMAPELFSGMPPTERGDVFSLGLIFHDLLTGGAISAAEISLQNLLNRITAPPSSFNPKVSKDLDELVLWATCNDPELRCPSIKEFLKRLSHIESAQKKDAKLLNERDAKSPGERSSKSAGERSSKSPDKESSKSPGVPDSRKRSVKSSDQREKNPAPRRLRYIGALTAILICLIAIIQFKYSAFDQISKGFSHLLSGSSKIALNNSRILELAKKCSTIPLDYKALRSFSIEEDNIFRKYKQSTEQTSHCRALKSTLNTLKQGTLSLFIESRLRHRQWISQQAFNSNYSTNHSESSIETGTTELLQKCYETHWEGFETEASNMRPSDLAIANLIFFDLWQQIREDKEISTKTFDQFTDSFFEIPLSLQRTTEGKALLHSFLLSKLFFDRRLIPSDSRVLFQETPYDNEYLKALRLDLSKQGTSTRPSGMPEEPEPVAINFEQNLRKELSKSLIFLKEIRIKTAELKMDAPKRDVVDFLAPTWQLTDDVALKFKDLMKNYVEHINQGWYIMHLSEDRSQWDVFLMKSIRDCLKYSWYGFHHIFARQFSKLGNLNPASEYFTRTYSKYWQGAAFNHVESEKLSQLGFTVCAYNDISKDLSSLNDDELKGTFYKFILSVKKQSINTGLALAILESTSTRTKAPAPEETKAAFNSLFKMESEITIEDFDGWAALMCVISNEMFLELKRQNKNKERAMLSVALLEKIAKYHKDGKFITTNMTHDQYANPESLKQSTLLNCCDAYLSNGGNFLTENSYLASEISAEMSLKLLVSLREQNTAAGGGIAAEKILNNQVLGFEDLVINPLRYR